MPVFKVVFRVGGRSLANMTILRRTIYSQESKKKKKKNQIILDHVKSKI